MDKLLSSIKTLATPKNVAVLSLGSFLLLMSFLTPLIGIPLLFDYKIDINPEIKFDKSILECLEQKDVLAVNIIEPTKYEFYNDETIIASGEYNFKCNKIVLEEVELFWFFDDSEEPFANSSKVTVSNLSLGKHKLKFIVTGITLNGKKLSAESVIELNSIERPAPPLPVYIPPVHTNVPPTPNIIRPANGDLIYVRNQTRTGYSSSIVTLYGTGSDLEDGTLSGSSLEWFYIDPADGASVSIGSGNTQSITFTMTYAQDCQTTRTIVLRAIDSQGQMAEQSITLNLESYCLY